MTLHACIYPVQPSLRCSYTQLYTIYTEIFVVLKFCDVEKVMLLYNVRGFKFSRITFQYAVRVYQGVYPQHLNLFVQLARLLYSYLRSSGLLSKEKYCSGIYNWHYLFTIQFLKRWFTIGHVLRRISIIMQLRTSIRTI